MAKTLRNTGGIVMRHRQARGSVGVIATRRRRFLTRLRQENARRNKDDPEFELADTGIFEGSILADHGGLRQGFTRRCVHAHQRA